MQFRRPNQSDIMWKDQSSGGIHLKNRRNSSRNETSLIEWKRILPVNVQHSIDECRAFFLLVSMK